MRNQVDILLVDDREDGLITLEAILKSPRYNLIKARSGIEALSLLPQYDFAIILLDVQMPGMDGFETARRVKQLEDHRHTPIIFVTAINKEQSYVFEGYKTGAVDYIFKPFEESILRSKVSVFVELYEKSKRIKEQAQQLKENASNERYFRLAQLELESLKRYQNLADSIPHSVWRAKADGTMDYFNKVWTEYTGLSDQQSLGVGWQSAFDADDLRVFLKTWMQKIDQAEEFQVECRIRNRQGELRWHLIRAVAERRSSGEIIAWLGTCTNIHERKDTEERLMRAQQKADAASKAKTNFLANMSHEIRTPLNSILGFTELMMCSPLTESEFNTNLMTIQKNGKVLLKIIDEILDISKVEAGHLEMEKVEVDLCQLYQDVYSLLEIQAQEKKLEFKMQCSTTIPSKIISDPTRYRQILVNIIGNSLKFTEKGKVEVKVSWQPELHLPLNGVLRCTIVDTGIGIESNESQDLFQPFVQVDSSMTRKFGGTGLGLALSRKLAKALGGDVRMHNSKKNKGSTFVVDIQTLISKDSQFVKHIASKGKEQLPSKLDYKNILEDVKVLVVDDSADNRNLITLFLKGVGAQVDCAVDGYEGVQKALTEEYQIILMDIQMPNLDGYKATMQLREKGFARPIIALTAHALRQEMENSLKAGCSGHLTKPIDRKTLIENISKHVQESHALKSSQHQI